jgi:cytochrome c oxidase subunit 2
MLQYLLTFVVLAQPAQPAQPDEAKAAATAPAGDARDDAPAPAGDGKDAAGKEASAAPVGDPCDKNAPRPTGKPKKVMPTVGERTDEGAGTFWMPPANSVNVPDVDVLFYAILAISIFCFVGITVAVVWFSWKYRHRKGHRAEESSSHNDALEITWTIIPSIVCVIIFLLGWKGFVDLNTPPKHALEVTVVAEKWKWSFKYPNGWVDDNLHVPEDESVRLVMRSKDVLHSFWVPSFRVKQDVIPNRYTKLWFQATDPGVYRMYCAEYCGDRHSFMKALVVVHPKGSTGTAAEQLSYQSYMEQAEEALLDMPPVALGEYLYAARGCNQCHSIDGTAKTGPTWKGIFGADHATSAGTVKVDENYIRESIEDPNAKVRAGFNAVMPTFKGQLKDEQIDGLITYIKCLK